MTPSDGRPIGRRSLILGAGAASAGLLLPAAPGAQTPLLPTPGQTEGPFYPVELPADRDADLVRVTGQAAEAMGQVTHLRGRILDRAGRPVRDALVEIWQCDANGIYRHPGDARIGRRDPAFQGYGRALAGADGAYAFRTIRPVAYPGRTPHIHVAVHVPGRGRLVTQMYVAGEPLNARDGVLAGIRDRAARERLLVRLDPAPALEPRALSGVFDIVVEA